MAYATTEDLAERFPRTLTPAETVQAETMLEDASFLLNCSAPGLMEAVEADNEDVIYAAMLLTVAMVRRALLAQAAQQAINPAVDQIAQTFGPYSSSIKYRNDSGNLYLYDREMDMLLGLLRGDMSAAVSMRSKGL